MEVQHLYEVTECNGLQNPLSKGPTNSVMDHLTRPQNVSLININC